MQDIFTEWTPSDIDFVEAIATNPDIYTMASQLPRHKRHAGGRPSTHPTAVYAIYIALAGVLGSHRKAACVMANKHHWKLIRDSARTTAQLELAVKAPTRNMCEYHRKQLSEHADTLADAFRDCALAQAFEHGLLNAATPRSAARPSRANFAAADGKVAKCPVSQKIAAKWTEQGRQINADLHTQGGDPEPVFGAKFWWATTRAGNRRNSRVILDVRHVGQEDGGEAAVATDALASLSERTPGLHGVCYDGAFRGKHIDRLLKRGLTVLSPTHGGIKATPLTAIDCSCGDQHELWTRRGEICERTILDTGEIIFTPRPIVTRYRRPNADGSYRWYIEFAAPGCGTIHRQRIDITEDDEKRRYNRAEHLRQYIKEGADGIYSRCYGWREDAESLNDLLQQALHKGRMIAYSAARQYLVMLGFAIGRNSLARLLHQRTA